MVITINDCYRCCGCRRRRAASPVRRPHYVLVYCIQYGYPDSSTPFDEYASAYRTSFDVVFIPRPFPIYFPFPHPLNSVLVNYYPPSVCIHIGLRSTLLNHLIGVVLFFSFGSYDDGRIADDDDRLAVPCDGDSLASNLSWRFWEVGGSYPNEPTPKPPCSELLLLTRSSGAAAGHGFHLFHH